MTSAGARRSGLWLGGPPGSLRLESVSKAGSIRIDRRGVAFAGFGVSTHPPAGVFGKPTFESQVCKAPNGIAPINAYAALREALAGPGHRVAVVFLGFSESTQARPWGVSP